SRQLHHQPEPQQDGLGECRGHHRDDHHRPHLRAEHPAGRQPDARRVALYLPLPGAARHTPRRLQPDQLEPACGVPAALHRGAVGGRQRVDHGQPDRTDTDLHPPADRDSDANGDPDGYGYADADQYPDADGYADRFADTDGYADQYPDADGYA